MYYRTNVETLGHSVNFEKHLCSDEYEYVQTRHMRTSRTICSMLRRIKNVDTPSSMRSTREVPGCQRTRFCFSCGQCHIKLTPLILLVKGKVLPYSLSSVGPRADPGVQAVSLQVTF